MPQQVFSPQSYIHDPQDFHLHQRPSLTSRPTEHQELPPAGDNNDGSAHEGYQHRQQNTNEWLELYDPESNIVVYANPATGECSWNKPEGATIKPRDEKGEWWMLQDEDTGIPYYYNTTTGEAEWEPPLDATIIPFEAFMATSTGKRLSMVVANRASLLLGDEQASALVRRLSRTSLKSGSRSTTSFAQADPSIYSDPVMPSNVSSTTALHQTNHYRHHQSLPPLETFPEAEEYGYQDRPNPDAAGSQSSNDAPTGYGSQDGLSQAAAAHDLPGFHAARPGECVATTAINHNSSGRKASAASVPAPPSGRELDRGRLELTTPTTDTSRPRFNTADNYLLSTSDSKANSINSPSTPFSMASEANFLSESLPVMSSRIQTFPDYASLHFAEQKRGFFRKRITLQELISFSLEPISRSLLKLSKDYHRDAIKMFKTIQRIMGDRPHDRDGDAVSDAHWMVQKLMKEPTLIDEAYSQLCKQLTNNPTQESVKRGWGLFSVLAASIRPTKSLYPSLLNFVESHASAEKAPVIIVNAASYTRAKLTRVFQIGPRRSVPSLQEINLVLRRAPFRAPVFGVSLEQVMLSQDNVDPQYKLPRLLTFLVGLILKLKGMTCEGIFRVPGNQDLVSMLRVKLEAGDYNADGLTDPHVVASLLKEWLRELSEPLIPERLYEDCVANADNPGFIIGVVRKIPDVHQRAISFLIQLVQILTTPENEATTKMDINNLALVFAPSFLRHPRGNDLGDMMANTNVEQTFVCNLVKHWSEGQS